MSELKCSADAIAEATQALYPDQVSTGFGVQVPYFLGGKDPLDFVEIYVGEKDVPYWHYITYGFSELYDPEEEEDEELTDEDAAETTDMDDEASEEDDLPPESGYGFELSFRLKKTSEEPPIWPVNLLQNLARYVFSSGNVFADGHHLDCNSPIALETDTKLTALGFLIDPELGTIETTTGSVTFLEVIGITHAEMEGIMCWNSKSFLTELKKYVPDGVTDLERDCLMENKDFYRTWEQGVETDGSSTAALYMTEFSCCMEDGQVQINLGAGPVQTFLTMLKARVGKGRVLYITVRDVTYCFQLAEHPGFGHEEADFCLIQLTERTVLEILEIVKPHRGEYLCQTLPLKFIVTPTTITDSLGNVLEVIE